MVIFLQESSRYARARTGTAVLLILSLLAFVSVGRAEHTQKGEYELKAAYIYNFLQFLDFNPSKPNSTSDTLKVCIVSNQESPPAFTELSTKEVRGKTITVLPFTDRTDLGQCHVIYFLGTNSPAPPARMNIITTATRLGVLTIGDDSGFITSGGMIAFVVTEKKRN